MSFKEFLKEKAELLTNLAVNTLKVRVNTLIDIYLEKAKEYLETDPNKKVAEYESKAIDYVMDKVELPLWLKPFKGLIKTSLRNLIENAVKDAIQKLN